MHQAISWLSSQLPMMEAALAELVAINSFSANIDGCNRVVQKIAQLLQISGLSSELVKGRSTGDHLVVRSQGAADRSPIILVGHLDTVFPPGTFDGYQVDGNRRRGPGVLDMKGGLIVIAWALKAIAETTPWLHLPSLRVVVVSDEEIGSPEGRDVVTREAMDCGACLVFESGRSTDQIVTRRKGTATVNVEASGRPAHAGNAYWDGANAIWSLAKFVDAAQALANRSTGVTVNVGVISGGTSKNTVPAAASAEMDLRFESSADALTLKTQLQAIAKTCAEPNTSLQLIFGAGRPPMEATHASRALLAEYAACARQHGLGGEEASLQGGGSDGNTVAALGVPTIDGLGPRGAHFHTPDEYIEVDSLVAKAAALVEFLLGRSA